MSRNWRTKTAALLSAVGLVFVPVGVASAGMSTNPVGGAQETTVRNTLPVGVWKTTIDFGGGQMVNVTHSYTSKHELCHRAKSDNGYLGYGKGSWKPAGTNKFSYAVVEIFYDLDGNFNGHAEMRGDATITGTTFKSLHYSKAFDKNGNVLGEGTDYLTFTLVSRQDPPCPAKP
ncbi:hypothetical protein [Lentzea flava]|uniref:Secreted protein n=1 Tax=Lentzea flava TaxID=103732 RepID=A0ABQ2V846_9PSEU|nr:hypothetical protein [Lentzea flava]MCP2203895.1 hypothetical protein [Lentzea flava]GGU72574.1 hypothetical protein GCM10010178_75280 [Lentzea flava]